MRAADQYAFQMDYVPVWVIRVLLTAVIVVALGGIAMGIPPGIAAFFTTEDGEGGAGAVISLLALLAAGATRLLYETLHRRFGLFIRDDVLHYAGVNGARYSVPFGNLSAVYEGATPSGLPVVYFRSQTGAHGLISFRTPSLRDEVVCIIADRLGLREHQLEPGHRVVVTAKRSRYGVGRADIPLRSAWLLPSTTNQVSRTGESITLPRSITALAYLRPGEQVQDTQQPLVASISTTIWVTMGILVVLLVLAVVGALLGW